MIQIEQHVQDIAEIFFAVTISPSGETIDISLETLFWNNFCGSKCSICHI